MENKKFVEVIWFYGKNQYYWAAIPLVDEINTVQTMIDSLPWPIDLENYKVGIWGKQVKLDDVVSTGDRIEITQPLKLTPNEIRLRRKKSN
ncbi:MAG: RnfH family protein [Pseudomonadota bacterium]|nr:RnfH family protein [Pseudomonadota bacterium]